MTPEHLVGLALACVGREYPNHISHLLESDTDAAPPRRLTPAFFGCFDWHSAVHSHWLLARMCRLEPDADYAGDARTALARALTPENIAAECDYVAARPAFERPYGMAWLLQLVAELHDWEDTDARTWRETLRPLEDHAAAVFENWLPKLPHPVRSGTHDQTAFSLGLVLDWARIAGAPHVRDLVERRSLAFYANDRDAPLSYEPSGHDFLSPSLAEADLMRRLLPADTYREWFAGFLGTFELDPVAIPDVNDGHLVHLAGLNLSRAWMLEGIASVVASGPLAAMATRHRSAGLAAFDTLTYAGAHWLATFAAYLTTRRGLATT
ncbi:MAG: DUF2891 domain-containing protein [Gammaproteobacteria bacterium]|nr:DUF2891 domain-containing protein [Gammaproteobacteria bacterium]